MGSRTWLNTGEASKRGELFPLELETDERALLLAPDVLGNAAFTPVKADLTGNIAVRLVLSQRLTSKRARHPDFPFHHSLTLCRKSTSGSRRTLGRRLRSSRWSRMRASPGTSRGLPLRVSSGSLGTAPSHTPSKGLALLPECSFSDTPLPLDCGRGRFCSGLKFTAMGLRHSLSNPSEELSVSFTKAYEGTLKQYHSMFVKPVFLVRVSVNLWVGFSRGSGARRRSISELPAFTPDRTHSSP